MNNVIYIQEKDQIVSASGDNTLRVWCATTRECLQLLSGHKGSVTSLCYIDEIKQLVSGSTDQTIKLWSLPLNKKKRGICVVIDDDDEDDDGDDLKKQKCNEDFDKSKENELEL